MYGEQLWFYLKLIRYVFLKIITIARRFDNDWLFEYTQTPLATLVTRALVRRLCRRDRKPIQHFRTQIVFIIEQFVKRIEICK